MLAIRTRELGETEERVHREINVHGEVLESLAMVTLDMAQWSQRSTRHHPYLENLSGPEGVGRAARDRRWRLRRQRQEREEEEMLERIAAEAEGAQAAPGRREGAMRV